METKQDTVCANPYLPEDYEVPFEPTEANRLWCGDMRCTECGRGMPWLRTGNYVATCETCIETKIENERVLDAHLRDLRARFVARRGGRP